MDCNHLDEQHRLRTASPTRRGVGWALSGLVLGATLGRLNLAETEAKNRKRKKKKCKGGKKKCGKGCCSTGNACVVGICFCLDSDPPADAKCRDVAEILIEIIAEETGIPPGVIGANPEDPLEEQVTIDEDLRLAIDEVIKQTFGVEEEVPYYTEGITAGAAVIREELVQKG